MASSFVGPSGLSFEAYGRILGDAYGRSLVWNSVRLGRAHDRDRARRRLSRGFRPRLCARRVAKPVSRFPVSTACRERDRQVLRLEHAACARMASSTRALMGLHLTSTPIRLLFTQVSLISGSVNIFLPFMILPIYSVIAQIDPSAYRSGCDARRVARARVPARCRFRSRCPELSQASRSSFRSPFRPMSCRHCSWARAIRPWRRQSHAPSCSCAIRRWARRLARS